MNDTTISEGWKDKQEVWDIEDHPIAGMNDNTLPEGWNYQFIDKKSSAGWKMEAGGLRHVEDH